MMDYDKLTDRELDALVAERVMGWEVGGFGDFRSYRQQSGAATIVGLIPRFATNDNAARLVRNRIAELGLTRKFMHELHRDSIEPWWEQKFCLLQIPSRQQAIAALRAVEGSKQR